MGEGLQSISRHKGKIGQVWAFLKNDPRHYQIGVLSSLICLGVFQFAFALPWWHVVACVGSTLTTQAFADKIIGRKFDVRSPLISALSLTILLRTGSVWLSLAAGILAIGSNIFCVGAASISSIQPISDLWFSPCYLQARGCHRGSGAPRLFLRSFSSVWAGL